MASADFCMFSVSLRRRLPTFEGTSCRPPQVRAITFIPCTCPSLLLYSLAVWGFVLFGRLTRIQQPQIGFVYLRSGLCRRLPSDSTSRWTPLPWANGWYSQPPFGTYTLELSPMLGAQRKKNHPTRVVFQSVEKPPVSLHFFCFFSRLVDEDECLHPPKRLPPTT